MFDFVDLTDKLPFNINLPKLKEEVRFLSEDQWKKHYHKQEIGWLGIPLVSVNGLDGTTESLRMGKDKLMKKTPILKKMPYFEELLDQFQCPFSRIRLFKLEPGGFVDYHRDVWNEVSNFAFGRVRLAIPIFTNEKSLLYLEKRRIDLKEGHLYYVDFSKNHFLHNQGETTRVHLIIELKVNEWLKQIFPKLTVREKFECFFSRLFLPLFWVFSEIYYYMVKILVKFYERSWLHRLRLKYFPLKEKQTGEIDWEELRKKASLSQSLPQK